MAIVPARPARARVSARQPTGGSAGGAMNHAVLEGMAPREEPMSASIHALIVFTMALLLSGAPASATADRNAPVMRPPEPAGGTDRPGRRHPAFHEHRSTVTTPKPVPTKSPRAGSGPRVRDPRAERKSTVPPVFSSLPLEGGPMKRREHDREQCAQGSCAQQDDRSRSRCDAGSRHRADDRDRSDDGVVPGSVRRDRDAPEGSVPAAQDGRAVDLGADGAEAGRGVALR